MSRLRYCALLFLVWAGIYLPGLGSTELKGEEGRRILPAITMLETGHWLVPYVGGEPFLRKPPLVNWAIAGAFKLTGVRNGWTARLPSALCVLALGIVIIATTVPRALALDPHARWLSPPAGFVAAIFAITFAGLLAKARFAGAEIEGIYAPISGMAIVCWLAGWSRGCSPWLTWTVPGVLLGIASLAKGPSLHLLFFYAVVLGVLLTTRRWRELFHPAHFLGLALCAGIFAAWAVPYFRSPETIEAMAVWKRQGIDRFTGSEFNAVNYLTNLPRALGDLLPWLVFGPLLRAYFRRPRADDGATEATRLPVPAGALVGASLAFALVLLVPGTLPRYVLPLGSAFALALAAVVDDHEVAIRRWFIGNRALAIVLIPLAIAAPVVAGYPLTPGEPFDLLRAYRAGFAATSALACCTLVLSRRAQLLTASWNAGASAALLAAGMLLYAGAAIRWIKLGDSLRPLAAQIDAAVPPGATLTLFDPGYQPWIFYLRSRYDYATELDAIHADTPAVLVRSSEKTQRKFSEKRPDLALVQAFRTKAGAEYLLYRPR